MGISISLHEFKKLNLKEQNSILFKNTEELKNLIRGYKYQIKVGYIWLTIVSVAIGINKYIGVI
jgi:hypothetical protein